MISVRRSKKWTVIKVIYIQNNARSLPKRVNKWLYFKYKLTRQQIVCHLFFALTVSIRSWVLFSTLCGSINTKSMVQPLQYSRFAFSDNGQFVQHENTPTHKLHIDKMWDKFVPEITFFKDLVKHACSVCQSFCVPWEQLIFLGPKLALYYSSLARFNSLPSWNKLAGKYCSHS
jgi:hypothetical protein